MEAIPKDWLDSVSAILRNGHFNREIAFDVSSYRLWDADTLGEPKYVLIKALIDTLKPGVMGKFVPDQREIGQTYAFWIPVHGFQVADVRVKRFYGKICLYPDHIHLKLLSAHRPRKGQTNL